MPYHNSWNVKTWESWLRRQVHILTFREEDMVFERFKNADIQIANRKLKEHFFTMTTLHFFSHWLMIWFFSGMVFTKFSKEAAENVFLKSSTVYLLLNDIIFPTTQTQKCREEWKKNPTKISSVWDFFGKISTEFLLKWKIRFRLLNT